MTIIQKIQPGSVYLDSYGEIFLMFTTQILGLSKKKKRKLRRFNQNIQLNERYIYMLFFSF